MNEQGTSWKGTKKGWGIEKRVLAFIRLSQCETDVITSSLAWSAVSSQVTTKERSPERNERLIQRRGRRAYTQLQK